MLTLVILAAVCVSCKPSYKNLQKLRYTSNNAIDKAALTKAVHFKDCGSKSAKVVNVTISPCTKEPCPLITGQNATIGISFMENAGVAPVEFTKSKVYGIVLGIKVPFPIDDDNGCNNCGITCPVKAGSTYSYSYSLYIDPSFPAVDCIVQWELKATSKDRKQDSDDLFCIQVPVQVKKG